MVIETQEAAADAAGTESRFEIQLTYSERRHLGDESRSSPGQIAAESAERQKTAATLVLLKSFDDAAVPLEVSVRREYAMFQHKGIHHFDGGIDITHITHVIAACAGALPLSVFIKASRDVLVAWLGKKSGSIKVKLGGGQSIEVGTIAELDQVLTRLEGSEFAKITQKQDSTKDNTEKAAGEKDKAK